MWKMEGQERPRRRERCDTCGGARKKIVVNKRSGKRYQKYSVYEHEILHVSEQCVRM